MLIPNQTVDMSPEAIALRLQHVDELRRLGLSLVEAGQSLGGAVPAANQQPRMSAASDEMQASQLD